MSPTKYPPLVALAVIAVILGCGSPANLGNAAAAASTAASVPSAAADAAPSSAVGAPSSPPSCADQVSSWWLDSSGQSQNEAVQADLQTLAQATGTVGTDLSDGLDPSQAEAAVQSDAITLQSDTQAALTNLPPSCASPMRADLRAALADASKGAQDCLDLVSATVSGDTSAADSDTSAIIAAFNDGSSEYQAVTGAVEKFIAGTS